MADSDYSAVGPCEDCCNFCLFLGTKGNIIISISGLTLCQCYDGATASGGDFCNLSGTINGAFTIPVDGSGNGSITISNAITVTPQLSITAPCDGGNDPTNPSYTVDLVVTIACSLGGNITLSSPGLADLIFDGRGLLKAVTPPILNANTDCNVVSGTLESLNAGFGGTASISW